MLPTEPRASRQPNARRCWMIAGLAALGLYAATAAPGVVWQDGGDMQVRVALHEFRGDFDLARVHLLNVLLASGLSRALSVDPARAANLVSVLAGALTVANLAALLALLLPRYLPVAAVTILFACSHTHWQFSTMAETHALAAAFLSAELLALQRFAATGRGRYLWYVGLFNGVGAANHNIAFLTLAGYGVVALCLLKHWRAVHARHAAVGLVFWLIGFSPMLTLIVGDLAAGQSASAVARSLFVGAFARQVFNLRLGPADAARVAAFIALNFPSPLILLLPFGCKRLRALCSGRLFLALVVLLVVHFLFAARYNVPDQYAFFIPTYLLSSVFLAAGLHGLCERHNGGTRKAMATLVLVCALLPAPFYALLPAVARRLPRELVPVPRRPVPYRDPFQWFLQPWHHHNTGPLRFAREAFDRVPPDAILLVDPTMRPPLLYLQNVEHLRPDVQINDGRWQDWRQPVLIDKKHPETFDPYVAAGRVFVSSDHPTWTPNYGWVLKRYDVRPDGPLYRVSLRAERTNEPD